MSGITAHLSPRFAAVAAVVAVAATLLAAPAHADSCGGDGSLAAPVEHCDTVDVAVDEDAYFHLRFAEPTRVTFSGEGFRGLQVHPDVRYFGMILRRIGTPPVHWAMLFTPLPDDKTGTFAHSNDHEETGPTDCNSGPDGGAGDFSCVLPPGVYRMWMLTDDLPATLRFQTGGQGAGTVTSTTTADTTYYDLVDGLLHDELTPAGTPGWAASRPLSFPTEGMLWMGSHGRTVVGATSVHNVSLSFSGANLATGPLPSCQGYGQNNYLVPPASLYQNQWTGSTRFYSGVPASDTYTACASGIYAGLGDQAQARAVQILFPDDQFSDF